MNKKIKLLFLLAMSSTSLFAGSLKITNTVGADSQSITDSDLIYFSIQDDTDGEKVFYDGFTFGDRLQGDFTSKFVSGRLRLEASYNKLLSSSEDSFGNFYFNPEAYVLFTPVKQLGFFAGNSAFKKFTIPSSYLAAADDYTKYGRMITSSVNTDEDYIEAAENFFIPSQVFICALYGNFTFGQKDRSYVKFAFTSGINCNQSEENKYALDSAVNFGNEKLFDFGLTARNFTGSYNMKCGVFAGLKSVKNLILNGAFYYNFTTDDYLPEAAVVKKNKSGTYYEYKKQKTLYAAGISSGYKFDDLKFGLYGDFITGLTPEYPYEKYSLDAIPFYAQIRIDYDFTEKLSSSLKFKIRSMYTELQTSWISLYPELNYELPGKAGNLSTGLHLDFNLSRASGVSCVSIPLTWSYRIY